jgi:WD40 repeat protein
MAVMLTENLLRTGNTHSWDERTTALTGSSPDASDFFGRGCAISKDGLVLAVGATGWDGGGGGDQGIVYIFDWNGSSWTQRGTIVASDAGTSDQFGVSCALSTDGAILAVGALNWDGGGGTDQGAVYIYDWNGSAWVERSTILTASDAGSSDIFGLGCALSSDGAILSVGAGGWDGSGGSQQGAVYIYDWNGSAWVERSTILTASDAAANFYYGSSCALSSDGSVLAVGSYLRAGSAGSQQGAVYIYDWDGSAWVEVNYNNGQRCRHRGLFRLQLCIVK